MGLELKEDKVPIPNDWDYTISITTNNQIRESLSVTDRLTFNVNDSHINNYEVVDERNHLKTVTSLMESDEVEWDM
ncbi:hypothetical protein [Oceanobacillus polygoni]|uniref:Uncharacterized protein n=1 Tax=Oceanobacillus polygoni TaxID=1235259 RepID=A0A9X0YTN3_9BACI|nr:hypothetical protein [Oceanobacillus polygoni]MBP2078424.1 hypothetical protein [Oceanobacillus polygoni]